MRDDAHSHSSSKVGRRPPRIKCALTFLLPLLSNIYNLWCELGVSPPLASTTVRVTHLLQCPWCFVKVYNMTTTINSCLAPNSIQDRKPMQEVDVPKSKSALSSEFI